MSGTEFAQALGQDPVLLLAAAAIAILLVALALTGRKTTSLQDRIRLFQDDRTEATTAAPDEQETSAAEPGLVQRLGAVLAASPLLERDKTVRALAGAGIQGGTALASFAAIKLACLAGGLALVSIGLSTYGLLADNNLLRMGAGGVGLLVGWRLPDLVLSRLGKRRRGILENGMPDALDLLVICAEAGLSLEQALSRVSRDLETAHPALAAELAKTVAEMRVLPDRRQALDNLASRTGLASARSIVATLSQTLKYGTPLAQSLRVLATEMRNARMLRFEERAARLPVMLTMPLIGFILPCLFVVVAGPAAIGVMDLMKG